MYINIKSKSEYVIKDVSNDVSLCYVFELGVRRPHFWSLKIQWGFLNATQMVSREKTSYREGS